MNLIEGDLKKEELEVYIRISPAAKSLYTLKGNGVSTDVLLDESIIYYERSVERLLNDLTKYINKYGAL